tara:strand:+ start:11328 stop:11801 length:474 start_codon:yes stop_codon:yes gene_type:complete
MFNNIKLIVYDFDGVMTDNKVYLDQLGNELVQLSRADGLAIAEFKKLNFQQIIISTEKNPVVSMRANKLKIECLQGIEDKKQALLQFCKKYNFNLKNVAYVGNDINDEEVMKIVAFRFCPLDAHKSIKSIAHNVLNKKGGDGVIRELLDLKEKFLIK